MLLGLSEGEPLACPIIGSSQIPEGLWFRQVYLEESGLSEQGLLPLEERTHRTTIASFSGPGLFLWNKNWWAVGQVTTRNEWVGLLFMKFRILCMGHALPNLLYPSPWFPFMLHPAEFNL